MDSVEIKTLRKKLGLTQQQLATELCVTIGTVARWESGGSQPSPLAMHQLRRLSLGKADLSEV